MNKIVKNINKKKVLVFFVFLIGVLLLVVFLNNTNPSLFKKGVDPDEIKLIETPDERTGINGTGTEEAEIHYVN